jgi:hypothetical protein
MQQRPEVAIGFADQETRDDSAGHGVRGEITPHASEQRIEMAGATAFTGATADVGELAKAVKRESDRPCADHASAHGRIGRLKGVIPIAVPIVDQRSTGNEARLALCDHAIAMSPEGFDGAGGGKRFRIRVS